MIAVAWTAFGLVAFLFVIVAVDAARRLEHECELVRENVRLSADLEHAQRRLAELAPRRPRNVVDLGYARHVADALDVIGGEEA